MSTPPTVLIAGAGPTGMMAALELSRFGIGVRLVEKAMEPATTSRAVGVQARTLELFEQRGLSAELVACGNPGVAVSAYGGGKRLFRLTFDHLDSRYPYVLLVSQAETERVLREALSKAGARIEWGVTMVAFGEPERGAGLTVMLRKPDGSLEEQQCDYMISAEGAHSTTRQTLGLAFEGKSLPDSYVLGDLEVEGDLANTDLHILSSEHGLLTMFPMGGRHFRLIANNPISTPSGDTAPTLAELQQLYDQRSHLPLRLHDLRWSSWFRINSRMVEKMRVGRVFLGGDSAHIHSPAGGQGMNTSMQDMVNLSWKLAMVLKGLAKPALLDTYEAERLPIVRGVLMKTESLTDAVADPSALFRTIFNHVAPWLVGADFVQHKATEQMSQLALNYRRGPLSAGHGQHGSLHAGDRVPDLPVTRLTGNGALGQSSGDVTLFDVLDVSRFTLLACHPEAPARIDDRIGAAIAGWRHLVSMHQIGPAAADASRFTSAFGASPSLILVRPDGYIAFIGAETSLPALADYCGKWLETRDEAPSAEATQE